MRSRLPAAPHRPAVCWMKTRWSNTLDSLPHPTATSDTSSWITLSFSACWSSRWETSRVRATRFTSHSSGTFQLWFLINAFVSADPCPSVTMLIRGMSGRHAWTMQLFHQPRGARANQKVRCKLNHQSECRCAFSSQSEAIKMACERMWLLRFSIWEWSASWQFCWSAKKS